jgi:hypothetical protein
LRAGSFGCRSMIAKTSSRARSLDMMEVRRVTGFVVL